MSPAPSASKSCVGSTCHSDVFPPVHEASVSSFCLCLFGADPKTLQSRAVFRRL